MWLKSAQHLSKNPSILYYTILPGQVVLFNQSALQYELLTVTEYFLLCYFSRDSLPQDLKQSELAFQSPACKESPKQTDKSTKKSKGKLKKRSNINHESGLMQKGPTWALWKSDVVIDRDKYEGCGQKWRVCHSPRHAIHNRKKASREEKALWWAKGGRNRGRWGVKEQQQNWDRRRGWGSNSGREGSIVRYVVNR